VRTDQSRTDYELACCFERELYLQSPPTSAEDLLIPTLYPEKFSSPLLSFQATFQQCCDHLDVDLATAEILDDVRLLTLCITSEYFDYTKKNTSSKVQNTALSINRRLHALPAISTRPSETEVIHEAIRIATLIYTNCIMTLIPFFNSSDKLLLQILYETVMRVPLSRWKEIPGIFLWILLVAAPSSGNDAQGRFLKKKMAVAGMSIGLENFNLATGHLRAFWIVQRWIAREIRLLKSIK
jgi:hypothetical protein